MPFVLRRLDGEASDIVTPAKLLVKALTRDVGCLARLLTGLPLSLALVSLSPVSLSPTSLHRRPRSKSDSP